MRISDWSSDVCSSDLAVDHLAVIAAIRAEGVEIDPAIADLAVKQAGIARANAEAPGGTIFPIDIAGESLGDAALDAREDGAERHVHTGDAFNEAALVILARGNRDARMGHLVVEPLIAADDADIGLEDRKSELQSLMRISYDVFCLQKQTQTPTRPPT